MEKVLLGVRNKPKETEVESDSPSSSYTKFGEDMFSKTGFWRLQIELVRANRPGRSGGLARSAGQAGPLAVSDE